MGTAGDWVLGTPPAKPRRLRDALLRPRWIVTTIVIAAVVVAVVLATVPVAQSSTFNWGAGESGTGPIHFGDSYS